MNIGRVEYRGRTHYAEIAGAEAQLWHGTPFGRRRDAGRAVSLAECRLLTPVQPRQVLCIGLNYAAHARESGAPLPQEPLLFLKGVNAVAGPGDPIVLPAMAPDEVDYEAELVIVIGREAKNVSEADADRFILGYTCGNDVSARDCQLRRDSQWARAKSFDTFAPLGPWITTGLAPDRLDIGLTLNGRTLQQSNTSDLVFSCRRLVSHLSHCLTLYPGSVIMTGTPSGVGFKRQPPVFLRAGDTVTVTIAGIGSLTNPVVREVAS